MLAIKRLLGVWMLGRSVSSTSVIITRLLVSMAAIAVAIAFAAVFVLILTGAALWVGYIELTAIGYTPQIAIAMLSSVILALLVAAMLVVRAHVRKMQLISGDIFRITTSPVTRTVSSVADSFIDGFMYDRSTAKARSAKR